MRRVGEDRPAGKKELLERFRKELIAADGEFVPVKKEKDAAGEIIRIASETGGDTLTISAEEEVLSLGRLVEKESSLRLIRVTDLPAKERKEACAASKLSLVRAAYGIADIGALVFPYEESGTSWPHFLAGCLMVLLPADKILPDQFEFMKTLDKRKARNMVLVSGPSRTADIEKILILGAHGPARVVVLAV
jgi:L-lactate dehydrogenase complex protein LldG